MNRRLPFACLVLAAYSSAPRPPPAPWMEDLTYRFVFRIRDRVVFDAAILSLAEVAPASSGPWLKRKWRGAHLDEAAIIAWFVKERKVTQEEARKLAAQVVSKLKQQGELVKQAYPGLRDEQFDYDLFQDIVIGPDSKPPIASATSARERRSAGSPTKQNSMRGSPVRSTSRRPIPVASAARRRSPSTT